MKKHYEKPQKLNEIELTNPQKKLIDDLIESKDGHIELRNYHRNTVKALISMGIVTTLKYRKYGKRDGPVIRFRKGKEHQNPNIV